MSDKPTPMPLDECVRAYLQLAITHPEKPPKRVRDQRDNEMLIIGFNRAQETLRTILAHHGQSKATQALADVRHEDQVQPIDVGGTKLWLAS